MLLKDWNNIEYFKLSEFDSKDSPGSGNNMQLSTVELLDKAREIAKIPFIITSGYRTPEHNEKIGGRPNSSHLRGWAVDIRATNNHERIKIIAALIIVGFRRIGVADNFIHADNDPDKSPALWLYPKTFISFIKSLSNSAEDY